MMTVQQNPQCQCYSQGKCYVNAMTTPEDFDMHVPACHNCKSPVVKKKA